MKRLLPTPLMSVFLFLTWLALVGRPVAADVALAAVIAIVVPLLTNNMRPLRPHFRRLGPMFRLFLIVLVEASRSCYAVTRIVLADDPNRRTGFLVIPLDLRDPHGLAVLLTIINITPGTVWSGLSEDKTALTLHVLDLYDEEAWIELIRTRFETPLREIFE